MERKKIETHWNQPINQSIYALLLKEKNMVVLDVGTNQQPQWSIASILPMTVDR